MNRQAIFCSRALSMIPVQPMNNEWETSRNLRTRARNLRTGYGSAEYYCLTLGHWANLTLLMYVKQSLYGLPALRFTSRHGLGSLLHTSKSQKWLHVNQVQDFPKSEQDVSKRDKSQTNTRFSQPWLISPTSRRYFKSTFISGLFLEVRGSVWSLLSLFAT